MTTKNHKQSSLISVSSSVDHINDQLESNPHYPFNVQSGWLPSIDSDAMALFYQQTFEGAAACDANDYADSIKALDAFLASNEVLTYLIDNACKENGNIVDSNLAAAKAVKLPKIESKDQLLSLFNYTLTQPPQFINDDELVGLPFSAIVVGIDPTLSGVTLFGLPMFNEKMGAVLDDWNSFLASAESNVVFSVEGKQWLSPTAKKQYEFEIWNKDQDVLPYWKSWNSFFTRQFKDPKASRPISAPSDNKIVVSANDGSLFRWDDNVQETDVFWFKDMDYSISDILSSEVKAQQDTIDEFELVELFTEGSVFQTYLNPYNFHRWWCPANGEVLFDPITIPGAFFNKLVIPDFAGATTSSLPYLAQVNARGVMVIKTGDYGYVCCIPLGMSEVSTVTFDKAMYREQGKPAPKVSKGQEMGMFEYGGSSYVMIFQKLPGKRLIFQDATGQVFDKRPVLPKGSASTGGNVTLIGSQVGKWEDVDFNVGALQPWQNAGYVNEGMTYDIGYLGGLWTANPEINGGNLYGPEGSEVTATQEGYPLVGAAEGALIGRIGNNAPFLIGKGTSTPEGQVGQLYLTINDDLAGEYGAGLTDNVGQLTVSITPKP